MYLLMWLPFLSALPGGLALGLRSSGVASSRAGTTSRPEDFVELLAGTSTRGGGDKSDGNVLPQVKRPHGMNDWAPLTNPEGGAWWFRRSDTSFHGMRCTHQPSPWIGDYANFLLQPHMGDSQMALKYDATSAIFRPHYFAANLTDGQSRPIEFEFTPTSRAALVRVAFGESRKEAGHVSVTGSEVEFSDGLLRGRTREISHDAPKGWRGLFFAVKPVTPASGGSAHGNLGTLSFGGPATLAIGTSFISQEQADRNLEGEVGAKSFDETLTMNQDAWRSLLGRVRVEASDSERLRVFYTNLWRSMLFPRNLHEVDAKGQNVHLSPYTAKVESGRLVADSGFWDSYRTVYTLKSIIAPDQFGKIAEGWVNAFNEVQWLPQWASPDQRNSMVGTMGDEVLADAIAKQKWGVLPDFDTAKAYEAIRKDAYEPRSLQLYGREALDNYIKLGYVPASDSDESVTETQGYWLADAAISHVAEMLGKDQDAKELAARSKRYSSLFNDETMFFQPKNNKGEFSGNFDPIAWKNGFTEASAWQYRFDVPHDVEGLNKLFKGNLCGKIGEMMQKTSGEYFHVGGYGSVIHEMEEASSLQQEFGLYAHSNQPVHHILWIAKKAGCNGIADQYLRKVMRKLYTTSGWSGDEDNGEMASWYVLASLGIFQLEGAKDEMVLGSPSVIKGTVDLPESRILTVLAENQSDDNVYVQRVMWESTGGTAREISDNLLKYTELMRGGVLTFSMGASPQTQTQQPSRLDAEIRPHGEKMAV